MRRRPDSRPGRLPRYAAELPWLGPILGREHDARLRAGASSDPALGNAFAAVLVPARRVNGGLEADLGTAWFAPAQCDSRGRFAIEVPHTLERAPALLFALLYDLSLALLRSGRDVEPGATLVQAELARLQPGAGPVSRLPGRMREEIAERVGGLLERPAHELELALIELDPGAPDEAAALTFAVASCQYPAGFLDGEVAERSYRRLARCLEEREQRPRGLLLLGDQVYVDATAGLFDPRARYDRYDLPYERWLRMRGVRQVLRRLPVYAMLDDHEIEDNWEPSPDEATGERLRYGRRSYLRYQRLAGPRARQAVGDSALPLWYDFRLGRFPFFMADTRTERCAREARTVGAARIMSRAQRNALYAWLDAHAASDVPKFICSPSAFLPRHRRDGLRSDTWHGYPASFEPLLRYIVDKSIRNVVFLSGDEHISFVTRAFARRAGARRGVLLQSIHSSALYAPFTFANSLPEDLAGRDGFDFDAGRYRCTLHTRFAPPGDGFTVVEVRHTGRRWRVDCRFYRGADPDAHRSPMALRLAR